MNIIHQRRVEIQLQLLTIVTVLAMIKAQAHANADGIARMLNQSNNLLLSFDLCPTCLSKVYALYFLVQ
jgi:hypothetical protein